MASRGDFIGVSFSPSNVWMSQTLAARSSRGSGATPAPPCHPTLTLFSVGRAGVRATFIRDCGYRSEDETPDDMEGSGGHRFRRAGVVVRRLLSLRDLGAGWHRLSHWI